MRRVATKGMQFNSIICSDSDEENERSLIQTRSISAAAKAKQVHDSDHHSSSDDYVESEEDEEEEEEEVEAPVVQQQKTRMVTRQMSLIMNNQMKVKVQPFVDHTEDSLR